MSARVWPLGTIVFGLATLALVIAFGLLPSVQLVYAPGDFGPAMSAFQRATSMDQVNALFGNPADAEKLAAMTDANTLDLYAFIPAYALFLIAASAMLAGGVRRPLALLAIATILTAAIADVIETSTQLQMSTDWSRAAELLPIVAPACWTKYFALAAHALICSAICLLGARKRWIIGALGFIPIAGVFAAWAGAVQFPALMTAVFGLFWLALLGIAIAEAMRKRAA